MFKLTNSFCPWQAFKV